MFSRRRCEVTAEKNGLIGFGLVLVHVSTPFSAKPGAEEAHYARRRYGALTLVKATGLWGSGLPSVGALLSQIPSHSKLFVEEQQLVYSFSPFLLTASLDLPSFSLQVEAEVIAANRR